MNTLYWLLSNLEAPLHVEMPLFQSSFFIPSYLNMFKHYGFPIQVVQHCWKLYMGWRHISTLRYIIVMDVRHFGGISPQICIIFSDLATLLVSSCIILPHISTSSPRLPRLLSLHNAAKFLLHMAIHFTLATMLQWRRKMTKITDNVAKKLHWIVRNCRVSFVTVCPNRRQRRCILSLQYWWNWHLF